MTATDQALWNEQAYWSEPAERAFAKARRKAIREGRWAFIRGTPSSLRSFDELLTSRCVLPESRQELRTVALSQIVGSVGKHDQFSRSFRPRVREMRFRWKRAFAVAHGLRGHAPVDLYQVDHDYYVVDGHYRVSVAVALGQGSIQAYVRRWV